MNRTPLKKKEKGFEKSGKCFTAERAKKKNNPTYPSLASGLCNFLQACEKKKCSLKKKKTVKEPPMIPCTHQVTFQLL